MRLKITSIEDLFIPPLQEYSYLCNGIITDMKCKGMEIYRDSDFIAFTVNDILSSMSLQGLIKMKTRGRKRERWLRYISKYKMELEPKEFSTVLRLGALLTIYVDGYEIEGNQGDVVVKEFRVSGTGSNTDHIRKMLLELSPRLIVIQNKNNIWYVVTGYKVAFVDSQLKKIEKSFVNSDRMECSEIQEEYNTRICLNPS
ncbi:MAG: hypothetical protein QXY87_12120 [Saccharolobus sp.]|uniref:Uncharacterized protein n=1 Tax=Saccharolobus shibatae TaxID=2286 RepID=A0A8F5BU53_9CREN|nr:hypothetical protein [Saccharolobus shibatae]MCH4815924.1 hypothetical protein [Saccharolobus shibatae]QXJ31373.1 Uncharacterized protein J5U21_01023 [Saccharolobus shibatae]QXJ34390.1 Uncharacterized protein J5U22_00936 [Saccharolobus shibatae]